MKKGVFALLCLFCSFMYAQKTKTFNELQWEQMEKFKMFLPMDSISTRLYTLDKQGQYLDLLFLSKTLVEKAWDTTNYYDCHDVYAFYVDALYGLNMKDSARALSMDYMDKIASQGQDIAGILFYSYYPCFYRIGLDTVINQYALKAYSNAYHPEQYPNPKLATLLLKLFHDDQLFRITLEFQLLQCNNTSDVDSVRNAFTVKAVGNSNSFLNIYKSHPNYITNEEVGPISWGQEILFWHCDYEDKAEMKIVYSILKRAMEDGHISADTYVHHLTQKYARKGPISKLKEVTDSLCRVYGCKGSYQFNTEGE